MILESGKEFYTQRDLECDFTRPEIADACFDFLSQAERPDKQTFQMLISYLQDKFDRKNEEQASKEFALISDVVSFFQRQMLILGKTSREARDTYSLGKGVLPVPKLYTPSKTN